MTSRAFSARSRNRSSLSRSFRSASLRSVTSRTTLRISPRPQVTRRASKFSTPSGMGRLYSMICVSPVSSALVMVSSIGPASSGGIISRRFRPMNSLGGTYSFPSSLARKSRYSPSRVMRNIRSGMASSIPVLGLSAQEFFFDKLAPRDVFVGDDGPLLVAYEKTHNPPDEPALFSGGVVRILHGELLTLAREYRTYPLREARSLHSAVTHRLFAGPEVVGTLWYARGDAVGRGELAPCPVHGDYVA